MENGKWKKWECGFFENGSLISKNESFTPRKWEFGL